MMELILNDYYFITIPAIGTPFLCGYLIYKTIVIDKKIAVLCNKISNLKEQLDIMERRWLSYLKHDR